MDFNKRCISKEEFKKHEDSDVAYALYVRDNLKPNDYFRTFDGQIFKSMNASPIEDNKIYYKNGYYTWADISAVDNFSDDPIDLIELGDYVNGYLVTGFDYQYSSNKKVVFSNVRLDGTGIKIPAKDIKSIVTKEMFDSVKYEVK